MKWRNLISSLDDRLLNEYRHLRIELSDDVDIYVLCEAGKMIRLMAYGQRKYYYSLYLVDDSV